MKCKRCSNPLAGKQKSYCSKRCSKLHLKSLYRKRKRFELSEYARKYRQSGVRPLTSQRRKEMIDRLGAECLRCGSTEDLDIHHLKPARLSGRNTIGNLNVFCKVCHQKFHRVFPQSFWKTHPPQS